MRAVIQRVSQASVIVENRIVGQIGRGIHILLGIRSGDTEAQADWLADKCIHLRIFDDVDGKFNHSCLETGGEVLVISQFTLYGNCRRGRRPSFTQAADPVHAERLYDYFVRQIRARGLKVETGIFAARMCCEIINEGPVTLIVDTEEGDG
ncbi:D-tyrosyl-tRNA(Tyr) deacylase [bacterium]|nr:D-tyrosyl-tRNA(Tyr) deacylase [bacterium]